MPPWPTRSRAPSSLRCPSSATWPRASSTARRTSARSRSCCATSSSPSSRRGASSASETITSRRGPSRHSRAPPRARATRRWQRTRGCRARCPSSASARRRSSTGPAPWMAWKPLRSRGSRFWLRRSARAGPTRAALYCAPRRSAPATAPSRRRRRCTASLCGRCSLWTWTRLSRTPRFATPRTSPSKTQSCGRACGRAGRAASSAGPSASGASTAAFFSTRLQSIRLPRRRSITATPSARTPHTRPSSSARRSSRRSVRA
mmetsp:Transcript_26390/g.88740  ORF Transcript_26390/g.88740 Transcript_26390/m.88740 type:complete len:261 (-) Transcript_26390:173-955(-)